jgi:hypothetical protein
MLGRRDRSIRLRGRARTAHDVHLADVRSTASKRCVFKVDNLVLRTNWLGVLQKSEVACPWMKCQEPTLRPTLRTVMTVIRSKGRLAVHVLGACITTRLQTRLRLYTPYMHIKKVNVNKEYSSGDLGP